MKSNANHRAAVALCTTTSRLPSVLPRTPGIAGAGRRLVERLGLAVVREDGRDLRVACVHNCGSQDNGHIDQDTGVYGCWSCHHGLSALDLCKVAGGYDFDRAKQTLIDLGLWQDLGTGPNGNGKPLSDEEGFAEVCRLKNVPPDSWKVYGAVPYRGGVKVPMSGPVPGPDGLPVCSSIHITPENGKGKYEFGKPTGLFLPGEFPDPGQSCIIVEGPKDAPALYALGHLAIGLPGNRLKKEFAPLFKGVQVTILTDGDKAGREGGAVTVGLLRAAGAASVKIASFPDGKDARDVIKTDGPEGIGRILASATEGGEGETGFDFEIITAAELLRRDCAVEFLIPDVLAKGQHHVLGGPLKCCKTLLATDLAVSLASGGRFLDYFPVARPVRTILLCGESGWPVFQENVRRIAFSRGVVEEQLENLLTGVRLPKFGNILHQETLGNYITEQRAEVVILDCAYRCIPGDSVSNQFAMGEILDSIGMALESVGATLILLCHTPKHVAPGQPLELDNLAFAGFSEFAAQWLIINRREKYEPGSGRHALWAVIGGRAGHSGTYAIDLDEGEFHHGLDREWKVTVAKSTDVRKEHAEKREKERDEKEAEKLESGRKRIVDTVAKFPVGESKTVIKTRSGLRPEIFGPAWFSLLDEGILIEVEIVKPNRKKPYDGYRLRDSETP